MPRKMPKSQKKPKQTAGQMSIVKNSTVATRNAYKQYPNVSIDQVENKGNDSRRNVIELCDEQNVPQNQLEMYNTNSESSDDDEYILLPLDKFLISLCNLCKCDIGGDMSIPCKSCKMTYYCSFNHMGEDLRHRELCSALKFLSQECGGHIFKHCGTLSNDDYRKYRIMIVNKVTTLLSRTLTVSEREIILFPKVCGYPTCRESELNSLNACRNCGEVAFCKKHKNNQYTKMHLLWCNTHRLFKNSVSQNSTLMFKNIRLPTILLDKPPLRCNTMSDIFETLQIAISDPCEYAKLTQVTTVPLTAWYGLKLCENMKELSKITIHMIGAESAFETILMEKWEQYFLHIIPAMKKLKIIFIGPELISQQFSYDIPKNLTCCNSCTRSGRSIECAFESCLYHEYRRTENFEMPDLICFFNAGLHRPMGFGCEDTWPETIAVAASMRCPIIVTSYTEFEAPLDLKRFVRHCQKNIHLVLPPTINPFTSTQPERNFISDENAPFIFKNYYCFVIESH